MSTRYVTKWWDFKQDNPFFLPLYIGINETYTHITPRRTHSYPFPLPFTFSGKVVVTSFAQIATTDGVATWYVDGEADGQSCEFCAPGKYVEKLTTGCMNCNPGKSTDMDHGFSECYSCPGGKFSTVGTTCKVCPAGKYSPDGAMYCTDCEPGSFTSPDYAIAGARFCDDCQAGKYLPSQIGVDSDKKINVCMDCVEGVREII